MIVKPCEDDAPHYTLEAFNAQQAAMYQRLAEARLPHMNNIGCPKCRTQMWDTLPLTLLTINAMSIDPANPPQQGIQCRAEGCGFTGFRLA